MSHSKLTQIFVSGNYPPLLLVLGYTQGIQVWLIPASGEAQEVLSWKYGQVKSLKVLPTPENAYGSPDNFAHCRPLIVMVDSTGPGTPFSSASFTSLKSGEVVSFIVLQFYSLTVVQFYSFGRASPFVKCSLPVSRKRNK
jgi:hypothetical protein